MLYAAWLVDPFRVTRDLDLLSLAAGERLSLFEAIRDVFIQPVAGRRFAFRYREHPRSTFR